MKAKCLDPKARARGDRRAIPPHKHFESVRAQVFFVDEQHSADTVITSPTSIYSCRCHMRTSTTV